MFKGKSKMAETSAKKERIIALMHGADKPGIVARISGWIYARGGNIHHADQHHDNENGIFFQRVEWEPAGNVEDEIELFKHIAEGELGMETVISTSSKKPKVAIMVSKFEHCFFDIIMRCRMGELNCEITCVISNHEKLRQMSEMLGLKFYCVPVTKENKEEAEAEQMRILKGNGADLIVMARYMQILSPNFLKNCGAPVINIHHSFLPAFAGAKPYHQAYRRGVKIIGATAHYATADLDEGPIIAQDVTTISHRNTVEDLIRKGRELERTVLANAVRWHLQNRILAYKNKTVVFD